MVKKLTYIRTSVSEAASLSLSVGWKRNLICLEKKVNSKRCLLAISHLLSI